ncbi:MAG: glycine--tRNA ligase subunit alpha [Thermoanaerobaculia bacterium]
MLTLQKLIAELSSYWEEQGCLIEQPYDQPMGAGTMHPATFLRVLGPDPWRCAYVQPSRRPADGRYGENPFRLGKHLQLQVVLKPSPEEVQDLYLRSLERLGIDRAEHDIRFEEDNWESPTLGAWGVGWQVVMDGMEITQFTYFQQAGGIDLAPVSAEITYGLERIAMFLSKVDSIFDIRWDERWTYGQVRRAEEFEMSKYSFETADTERTARLLAEYEAEAKACLEAGLVLPAYEATLQCSHLFNVLDARGAVSATDRVGWIRRVRELSCACARVWLESREKAGRELEPEPAAV